MSRALLIFGPCNSFEELAEVSRNFPKEIHSSKGRHNSFTNRTETATFMVNKRLTLGWITAHKYNDVLFLFLEQTVMVLRPSLFHCYVNLYPFSSLYGAFFAFPATLIFTTEIWKPKKGIVLSLFPVIFYSSLQTWFPDPSFRLVLGPVASISPKRPPPPCVPLILIHFVSFLPLFLYITAATNPLCFTVSPRISTASSAALRLSIPLSLSHFLFSPSAMFCDWQLKLDCKRVNREWGGIPRGFTAEWRRTNKIMTWE